MKLYFPFLFLSLAFSCSSTESAVTEDVFKMRVNSFTVECVGETEGTCLLIQVGDTIGTDNWELFYYEDDITGFEYEPGYIYDLLVKKIPVPDPPADASAFLYELVEIVSKQKV